MKQFSKKFWIALTLLCATTISALAYDFEVDGFYYEVDLKKMTAKLVAGEKKQTGEIIIPATVTYKGREFSVTSIKDAFSNNNELTKVTLPNSIVYLEGSAFEGCSSLQSISGLKSVTILESACFANCVSLTTIDLPEGLKRIGSQAFKGCTQLLAISIPDAVSTIGSEAFRECSSLSFIKLPSSIATLSTGILRGCSSLENIELPQSITTINDCAFADCIGITSITIPNNIQKIGNGAFDNCIGLTQIFIEAASTPLYVGYNYIHSANHKYAPLFQDCPLSKVELGRDISDSCFRGNSNLTEVIISKNVSSINNNAFLGCSNLKSITIPRSVISIGDWAFASSGLVDITFEDGNQPLNLVLKVPSWNIKTPHTFLNCNIENVYLGRNLQTELYGQSPDYGGNPITFFPNTLKQIIIGDYVNNIDILLLNKEKVTSSLSHYSNLIAAQFGTNLPQLPSMADNELLERLSISSIVPPKAKPFTNRQYINLNVEIPVGSLNAYQAAPIWNNFWDINQVEALLHCIEVDGVLYRFISNNSLEIIEKNTKYAGDMSIPAQIEYNDVMYDVSSLGDAFRECPELTSIVVPQSVHSMANNCFKNCSKLEDVALNCLIEEIPSGAFQGCISLSKIQMPETIKYFRKNAFESCYCLEDISPLNSVVRLEAGAFQNCTSLKEVSLPNINCIFDNAFLNCSSIEAITLGDGLETIGEDAFSYCSKLESLVIPGNVETFGTSMFTECSSLKKLVFADSNKPLSFPVVDKRNSVTITEKTINGEKIRLELEYYNSLFNGLPIEELYIGRNLSDSPRYTISEAPAGIGGYCIKSYDAPFSYLPELTKLTIGENVNSLGPDTTFIREFDLYVTPGAFKYCRNLETVTVLNPTPPSGAEFADEVYEKAMLLVPDNTISTFKSADGWKEFILSDEISANLKGINAIEHNCPLTIHCNGIVYNGEHEANIFVYDMEGKLYYSNPVSRGASILLPTGIYIVKVNNQTMKIKI